MVDDMVCDLILRLQMKTRRVHSVMAVTEVVTPGLVWVVSMTLSGVNEEVLIYNVYDGRVATCVSSMTTFVHLQALTG